MHTVDLLESAVMAAQRLGYKLRQEWFGTSGGVCEIRGQKWIFLDLSLSPADQLAIVAEALRGDPGLVRLDLPAELNRLLNVRQSA